MEKLKTPSSAEFTYNRELDDPELDNLAEKLGSYDLAKQRLGYSSETTNDDVPKTNNGFVVIKTDKPLKPDEDEDQPVSRDTEEYLQERQREKDWLPKPSLDLCNLPDGEKDEIIDKILRVFDDPIAFDEKVLDYANQDFLILEDSKLPTEDERQILRNHVWGNYHKNIHHLKNGS